MTIDTKMFVPITDANQSFSVVAKKVDEEGMAVLLRNDEPKYVVVSFYEYDQIQAMRKKLIEKAGDEIIAENMTAFKELAK